LELREHHTAHGTEATFGPFGPYRSWPPKPNADEGETIVPGAPVRDAISTEREHVDPVTGETLAPLQHEGSPSNSVTDPTTEV
jgi:hypothetical protein